MSCLVSYGTMILYHKTMLLSQASNIKCFGTKFITTYFNKNTCDFFLIFTIYKPLKMQTSSFLSIMNENFQNMPLDCPTIIIGDCNINVLSIRIE